MGLHRSWVPRKYPRQQEQQEGQELGFWEVFVRLNREATCTQPDKPCSFADIA